MKCVISSTNLQQQKPVPILNDNVINQLVDNNIGWSIEKREQAINDKNTLFKEEKGKKRTTKF